MGFLDRLLAAKAERYLLEGGSLNGYGLPGLLEVLGGFTPDGLTAFITADRSLARLYQQGLPPAVVKTGLGQLRSHKDQVNSALAGADWDRILEKIRYKLPGHAAVLIAHPVWYHREAQALMRVLREILDDQL